MSAVSRQLYASLVRSARRLDRQLAQNYAEDAQAAVERELEKFRPLLPDALGGVSNIPGRPSPALTDAVRAAFRASSGHEDLEKGFSALRRSAIRLDLLQSEGWEPKAENVDLRIGDVFRHRKHGFRGVVIRAWPQCPVDDDAWLEQWGPFKDGTEQAFYHTLVDVKDRPNPMVTVAAQENLEVLSPEVDAPVDHPLLDRFFTDFEHGRHVMKAEIRSLYPEDF